jgi:hypothetical protein
LSPAPNNSCRHDFYSAPQARHIAVQIVIGTEQFGGNLAIFCFLAKRQRAGAVQDASRISIIIGTRSASWSAVALHRFSQRQIICANANRNRHINMPRLTALKFVSRKNVPPLGT